MAERKLTIRMDADTAGLRTGLAQASLSTKTFGQSLQRNVTMLAPAIRATGIAITGVGAAMTAATVLMVKAGVDFQKQLAMVSTMLDETSMEHMPAYADGLRELSKEFGESTDTLATGLYNVLSATIPAAEALEVLETAAMGAAAGGTNTEVAVTALTKSMLAFKNLKPEEIMDMLFAAVQRGYLNFQELASVMPGVVTLGESLNISFEDLAGTVAFLSKKFPTASEAATGLEGVLTKLKAPTKEIEDGLAALGTNIDEVKIKLAEEGLQGTMQWLIDLDMGEGLIDSLFREKEAMLAITAMTGDIEGLGEDIAAVYNSAGATSDAFEKQTNTLAFQFEQLKQEVIGIFNTFGTALIPIIRDELIPKIQEASEFAGKLGEGFAELQPETRKWLALLGPLLVALGGFLLLLPSLLTGLGGLLIILGSINIPLALLIGGIIALAAIWYLKWDDIKEWTKSVYHAIAEKLDWEGFKEKVAAVWEKTKELIAVIGKVAISGYEWVREKFVDLGAWIRDNVVAMWSFLGGQFREIGGIIGGVFISGYEWIVSKFVNLKNWLATNIPKILTGIVELGGIIGGLFISGYEWLVAKFSDFWDWLTKNTPKVLVGIVELGGIIGGLFVSGYKWITQKFVDLKDWLFRNMPKVITGIIELGGIIGGLFVSGYKWIVEKFVNLKDWLFKNVPKVITGILELGGIVGGLFIRAYTWLTEKFANFGTWIKETVPKIIPAIVDLGGTIGSLFISAWKFLTEKIPSLWEALKNWFATSIKGKKSIEGEILTVYEADTTIDKLLLKINNVIAELPDWSKWLMKVGPQVVTATYLGAIAASRLAAIILPKLKATPIRLAIDIILIIGSFELGFTIGKFLTDRIKPLDDFVQDEVDKFQKNYPILWSQYVEFGPISVPGIKAIGIYIGDLITNGITEVLTPLLIDGKSVGQWLMDEFAKGLEEATDWFVEQLKEYFLAPIMVWRREKPAVEKAISEVSQVLQKGIVDWDKWGKGIDEETREVIDNVERIAAIVEQNIGTDIPEWLQKMSIALIASESSFNTNAIAVDKLGREYKGLGQHGEAAIEDLENMGLAIDDINSPASGLAATMAYLGKIITDNGGDVEKSILIYKGWGDQLEAVEGDIEKMPDEAKRQLAIFKELLDEFVGISLAEGTRAAKVWVEGESPGGFIPEFVTKLTQGSSTLEGTMEKVLSGLGDVFDKFLPTIVGAIRVVMGEDAAREFEAFIEDIKGMFEGLFSDTLDGIEATGEGMVGAVAQAKEEIKPEIEEITADMEAANTAIQAAWEKTFGEITMSFKSSISEWMSEGLTLEDFWNRLTDRLGKTWMDNFVDKLLETGPLQRIISSLTGWFNELSGKIGEAVGNLADLVWEAARFIATGIWRFVVGLWQGFSTLVIKLGEVVWQFIVLIAKTIVWIALNLYYVIASIIPKIWDFVGALGALIAKIIVAIAQMVIWIGKAIAGIVVAIITWFAETIPIVGWILGVAAAAAAVIAIQGLISGYEEGLWRVPEPMPVVVHEGEAILTASEAREWRAGGGGGGGVVVNVPRGAVVIYGDIRTKMDAEELVEQAGQALGERTAREIIRTVPL